MTTSRTRTCFIAGLIALLGSGCASQSRAPSVDRAPSPPWQRAALRSSEVPVVYVEEWTRAPNRTTCAPLAFASVEAVKGAEPRRATFSGGWAVAYDRADLRSAFGIAGTGVDATGNVYSEWPFRITWSDGSSAGYGLEGGTGPNHLAYLNVAGQACLYNVWSRLGREHLEQLLNALRRVQVEPAATR